MAKLRLVGELKIRRQRPIKGGRTIIVEGMDPRLERLIAADARRFHCTRQLVISTMMSDGYGIDLDAEDRFDRKPAHVAKKRA